MGLTKQYLRYVPAGSFNIIASQNCNAIFVTLEGQEGRYVAVGACEHVIIWDLRLGEKAHVLPGEKAAVTALAANPNKRHLAVGYIDGVVQVYDLKSAEVISIFSGHRSQITTLAYDSFGHKLTSGSKDTDIIVWDTVAEVGICRLSGHKGPITQLTFMNEQPVLISGAKDSFVKFWDLDTHHCFKTLVGHKTEVWGLTLMKNDKYLVTGCGDAELRVWKLCLRTDGPEIKDLSVNNLAHNLELATLEDDNDYTHPLQCYKAGSLLRNGKGRVISLVGDPTNQIIACHGTDTQIEMFYFCSDEETDTRFKKRLKKERKKQSENTQIDQLRVISLKDEVRRLANVKLSNKPKALHVVLGSGGELRVVATLANNTIDLYTLQINDKHAEAKHLRSISTQGHHSEIRAVNFSSDNLAIVSGSGESIKLWNRPSQTSLRTINTGYVLCTIFVPGDRHVLAGLKDGKLVIIDVAAGDILEEINAHKSEIWSMCLLPDMRGCATGSNDKTVKFWQFELIVDENSESKAKVLSLLHTRTLKLEDAVMCVKISPNSKFVAVALLDSTVKIFFLDTFKFYLSLYGHSLPVLCMDISSDSTLIVTGSADRNVKLWGMDFGDCHKSIFAHDDSITGVQFVPRTHYFFTCGKDGKIKEWDGDSYDKIVTLQGHIGEARNLAVSPNGKYLVSCGADRVLRLYEKTEQLIVLQDEAEDEREAEEGLATGEQTVVAGHTDLNLPSKKTIGSERGAESILECLEISKSYLDQLNEHAALQAASTQAIALPQVPLLMQAYNASDVHDFLLEIVKKIRPSDLEESLLLLPFASVSNILQLLPSLIERGDQVELVTKVALFLLKIHHASLVANHALLPTLKQLEKLIKIKVEELRDVVGYNLYGMQFLQRDIETSEGVQLFRDISMEKKKGDQKRKQREKLKRSILTLTA